LIHNGETANVGTAPWNVAIYIKKSDYEFICGGSIISRNLVVSGKIFVQRIKKKKNEN